MLTTEIETSKIINLAANYAKCFEVKTRDNGEIFVILNDRKLSETVNRELVNPVHGKGELHDDFIFSEIWESLIIISDAENDSDLSDLVLILEADIYQHKLLSWLNSGNDRFFRVDIFLEEQKSLGLKNALQICQLEEKQEIFCTVLEILRGTVESK